MTDADRIDEPRLVAWRSFLEAHARVTARLDDDLRAGHGLPLTWYDVLVQLHEAGGRLRMGELAGAVLLSRSNCTRLIDRMTEEGLVSRSVDTADARSRWAVLTPAGEELFRAAAVTHLAGLQRYFGAKVDPASAVQMAGAFREVTDGLR